MWALVFPSVVLVLFGSAHCDTTFTQLEIDNFPCNAKNLRKATRYVCDASGKVICLKGWKKRFNENPVHPCTEPVCSQGCVNGECIRPDTCACDIGWLGSNCSTCIPFPGCENGRCTNEPLTCVCNSGYRGKLCNRPICTSCVNGICTSPNQCTCFSGWSDRQGNCTVCEKHPGCKNGGCMSPQGTPVGNGCFCQPGWTGSLCDKPNCTQGCVNGDCVVLNNNPFCVCENGWKGTNCTECIPHPRCPGQCKNNKPWTCICDLINTNEVCTEITNCGCNVAGTVNPNVCTPDGTCTCKPDIIGKKCDMRIQPPRSTTKTLAPIATGAVQVYNVTCQLACRDIDVQTMVAGGNLDIFINVNARPVISGNTCTNGCMCSAVATGRNDSCPTFTLTAATSFIATIRATVGIPGGQFIITGRNVESCTLLV